MAGNCFQSDIESRFLGFCSESEELLSAMHGGDVPDSTRHYIVVSGSAPFVFADKTKRTFGTDDIDVALASAPAEILALFPKYDMNRGPSAFLGHLPYNYEDRLQVLVETAHMAVCAPSWEDLVFSKLRRYEDQDLDDIMGVDGILDVGFLAFLVSDEEESRASGISDEGYRQLASNFCDFMVGLHPEDVVRLGLEGMCREAGSVQSLYAVRGADGGVLCSGEGLAMFRRQADAVAFAASCAEGGVCGEAVVDGPADYIVRRVGNIRTYTPFAG